MSQETEKCYKVYVDVGVEFSSDGFMRPLWVRMPDGQTFGVDRVRQCVRAASRKVGGIGLRYTVVISGKECCLYYEENYRWFVEAVRPYDDCMSL